MRESFLPVDGRVIVLEMIALPVPAGPLQVILRHSFFSFSVIGTSILVLKSVKKTFERGI